MSVDLERSGEAPSIESASPTRTTFRIAMSVYRRPDGSDQGLELDLHACADPDCPCADLHVVAKAYDQRDGDVRVTRGESITAVFDATTGAVSESTEATSFEQEGMWSALRRWLRRKANKTVLAEAFADLRARIEPRAKADYDFSQHHDSTLASYLDIYETSRQIHFRRGESTWYLDDSWCVVPSCACGDGVIDVVAVPAHEPGARGDHAGSFWFVGRDRAVRGPRLSADRIAMLLDPATTSALEIRRERLRAEAARRWGTVRPRPHEPETILPRERAPFSPAGSPRSSVGRNEPCPCGSGKKFKHCCLKRLSAESFESFFAKHRR